MPEWDEDSWGEGAQKRGEDDAREEIREERQSLDPADHNTAHKVHMEGLWEQLQQAPPTSPLIRHQSPSLITKARFSPQQDLDRLNAGHGDTRIGSEETGSAFTVGTLT